MATSLVNIPLSQIADDKGYVTRAWQQYFLNPQVQTIAIGGTLSPSSGGTGSSTVPAVGQILVGNGTNFVIAGTLPGSAFPALTGDVTSVAGAVATTLANSGVAAGSYGTGTQIGSFAVDAKGRLTSATNVNITGASAMTVAGVFGCNGKAGQTSSAVNVAVAGTAGAAYTATEQGIINALVALVNQLRTALVNNGIAV